MLSFPLHLFVHIFFSFLAGFIVWRFYKKSVFAFLGAIFGGFLVDLDHLIDYFLAFGLNFDLNLFIRGYQFLKSDKIYILFHGWEYVIILLVLALILKQNLKIKCFILAVSLGLFFHLIFDSLMNAGVKFLTYSVVYRVKNNFDLKPLVTPENYQNHEVMKKTINFEN